MLKCNSGQGEYLEKVYVEGFSDPYFRRRQTLEPWGGRQPGNPSSLSPDIYVYLIEGLFFESKDTMNRTPDGSGDS